MSIINTRRLGLIAATGAGMAGAFALSLSSASAGHTNTVLEAGLSGRSEVATDATNNAMVGDPNGRGEAYVFGIDGDPTTLCYILTADKIAQLEAGGGMAHIHKGAAGSNGPVVVNLAFPLGGDAADCLTEGETNKFAVDANGNPLVTVAEILGNPAGFYVNVHNSEYPGGAIRGQLEALHS
jgi:CHRD domain